ncbi:hypothetical protein [Micromonospora zingiberis]|uniref:hypothetical protein n=1 Tax=Micromonospora zingiberis TaxID=2053011 RepID=UPI00197F377F|nr:hypothetical protein [Micromonospora zingiberis]
MTGTLAAVVTALGALTAGVALVTTRSVSTALGVLLDMLIAAGLLRLVGEQSGSSLAAVAAIVVLRSVLRGALLADQRRWRLADQRRWRSAGRRRPAERAGRTSGC